jgi:hypothetical protein
MAGEYVPANSATAGFGTAAIGGGHMSRPVARQIRRISAGSAFKVGAALYALLFAIIGIFAIVLPSLFGASLLAAIFSGSQNGGGAAAGAGILGLVIGLVGYLVGILLYGLLGGIFSAITALLYNLVAGWVGGLTVEITSGGE